MERGFLPALEFILSKSFLKATAPSGFICPMARKIGIGISKPLVPGPNPGGCSSIRRNSKEFGDRAVVMEVQKLPSPSEILPPTLKKWTLCGHPET
jgi:hypothetical protein